jgi:hypothetical protein
MERDGIVHTMREWNAATYYKVSDPQVEWGIPVLARLPLRGDELDYWRLNIDAVNDWRGGRP